MSIQNSNHSFREYFAKIFVDKYLSHWPPKSLKEAIERKNYDKSLFKKLYKFFKLILA